MSLHHIKLRWLKLRDIVCWFGGWDKASEKICRFTETAMIISKPVQLSLSYQVTLNGKDAQPVKLCQSTFGIANLINYLIKVILCKCCTLWGWKRPTTQEEGPKNRDWRGPGRRSPTSIQWTVEHIQRKGILQSLNNSGTKPGKLERKMHNNSSFCSVSIMLNTLWLPSPRW